ncbi:MAG TPA: glycosyltransferase 87 family protein [Actinomycetota bacterium]|nr:glycosyltransferase 87 family protein [Actinomycetota bacterium]
MNDDDRSVVVVLFVCAVMLIGGFVLKGQCLAPTAFQEGHQYSRLCYNDIQPLYGIRAIADDVFPYVDGEYTENAELIGGAIEYPVLTGLFLWFAGLFVEDGNSYLRATAVLLAPFGLVASYLLARMTGWRALLWAASPALVYYAFHNWDLLVVAAVVAGVWFWYRGRPVWAAVLFGVGAALKMYPILFVIPLGLERWVAGRKKDAAKVAAAGAGTALLINFPFMLINFSGWWATYAFHRARGPNYDSIWGLAQTRWTASIIQMPSLNLLTAVLTLATVAVAVIYGWERGKREGVYPFVQVAGALLVGFLLWNKVHSPQYTLWLLPFFVLLRVNVAWWVAYAVIDSVAYVGIFRWFYDITFQSRGTDTVAYNAMVWAVWGRALLLVVLLVVFLRARTAIIAAADESFSSPREALVSG